MFFDARTLATLTMIAAPTLMFLAASTVLLLVTGPSRAHAPQSQRIEIRGAESVEAPGASHRPLRLTSSRSA